MLEMELAGDVVLWQTLRRYRRFRWDNPSKDTPLAPVVEVRLRPELFCSSLSSLLASHDA